MTRKTKPQSDAERPRRRAPAGRGAVIAPSQQPRREQPTDASIGKGEDVIRPRDEMRDQGHAAPDQSAIDDAAGRAPGEEQLPAERDPMEPARDVFPSR